MKYSDWLKEQPKWRQELSMRLMDASYNLGKAHREGDKEIAAKYDAEIKQIYKEIGESDETS